MKTEAEKDKDRLDYLERKQYGISYDRSGWFIGGNYSGKSNIREAIDIVMIRNP